MDIILYTIDCPKCMVLERKLTAKNIKYTVCKDVEIMKSKGFLSAPMLEVNGEVFEYNAAIQWVNNYQGDNN